MVNRRAYNEDVMGRLEQSYRFSREQQRPFRNRRFDAYAQLAGHLYGNGDETPPIHKNWIAQICDVFMSHLVGGGKMGALVRSFNPKTKGEAYDFGLIINKTLEIIKYTETAREPATLASLLSPMGIIKVGMTDGGSFMGSDGMEMDANVPFMRSVEFGDFCLDWTADEFEECDWFTNRYQMPLEDVLDNKEFNRAARNELQGAQERPMLNEQGDERLSALNQNRISREDRGYRKRVELLDVYLPFDGGEKGVMMTVALMRNRIAPRPLSVREYEGPDHPYGPYRLLYYQKLQSNLMPVPPVAHWMELHDLINSNYRKLSEQARAAKTIGLVMQGSEDDATKVANAQNLDLIGVDGDAVNWMDIAGPDGKLVGFNAQLDNDLNVVAGNIESLGGLAAQSETATQDAAMGRAAGVKMSTMQKKAKRFDKEVMISLGDMIWSDDSFRLSLTKKVPNIDMEIPVMFDEEMRGEVDYLDLDIDIDPYSMQSLEAGERNQVLTQTAQELAMFAQQLQEAGKQIDVMELLRQRARLLNMPELLDLVTPGEVLPEYNREEGGGGPSHERSMPTNTKRTYERVGRPGTTPEATRQMAVQNMMNEGGNNNGNGASGGGYQ